jgi:hypothetical protein
MNVDICVPSGRWATIFRETTMDRGVRVSFLFCCGADTEKRLLVPLQSLELKTVISFWQLSCPLDSKEILSLIALVSRFRAKQWLVTRSKKMVNLHNLERQRQIAEANSWTDKTDVDWTWGSTSLPEGNHEVH